MTERKADMTEDWEQLHLPLDDPQAIQPPVTQCANCGELVHAKDVVIKQFYNGQTVDVEHYCSACHHQWYINRLRQWGM